MPVTLEHERMRWGYMYNPHDKRDMIRRLNRITIPEKLHYFMVLANEFGDTELIRLARERREELYPTVPDKVFEDIREYAAYSFEL